MLKRFSHPGLLVLFLLTPAAAQDPPVPQGEVTKYSFSQSKIFPGTVRDYWVYVPKQYDPARPACVYVNQDGIQFNAPEVFDQLIHKKEIPVVIGVFLMPGRVKATSENALDRFNRSFEYDGLGDNYVRFLLEELLPDVETKKSSDGRPIKLSKNGNDRAIGGSSSGAVCAFTAAWQRPDAFSRVFSAIGTYVGLRGANEYPTLIRKFEPKPIRIFLQAGSGDQNIYRGDWMANQEMERSLTFAGYEVKHSWDKGGHSNEEGTKVFPLAMRWLWRDWPHPVKVAVGAPQFKEILIVGEDWKLVAESDRGYGYTALAANAKGEVLFNGRTLRKVGLDGKVRPFFDDQKFDRSGSALSFGPDGLLYFAEREIVECDASGKFRKTVSEMFDIRNSPFANSGNSPGGGAIFSQIWHLIVTHNANLYCTTFEYEGLEMGSITRAGKKLWHINPKGVQKAVDSDLKSPTGLAVSPDQTFLYVAESRSQWVSSYQIRADGTLANKQRFYHLYIGDSESDSGAGGMCVDRHGRLYVATRMGIQICDQAGRVNCILPTPNRIVTSVCFGGANFDVLFAICGDKIYARKLKVKGANAFDAPIKPAAPQQ